MAVSKGNKRPIPGRVSWSTVHFSLTTISHLIVRHRFSQLRTFFLSSSSHQRYEMGNRAVGDLKVSKLQRSQIFPKTSAPPKAQKPMIKNQLPTTTLKGQKKQKFIAKAIKRLTTKNKEKTERGDEGVDKSGGHHWSESRTALKLQS